MNAQPDGVGLFYAHARRWIEARDKNAVAKQWEAECRDRVQKAQAHLKWVGKNLAKYQQYRSVDNSR